MGSITHFDIGNVTHCRIGNITHFIINTTYNTPKMYRSPPMKPLIY